MHEKFAGPIEEIALARVHVRRGFEFIDRGDKIAVLFFNLSQKIVEFGGVFASDKIVNQLSSVTEAPRQKIGES